MTTKEAEEAIKYIYSTYVTDAMSTSAPTVTWNDITRSTSAQFSSMVPKQDQRVKLIEKNGDEDIKLWSYSNTMPPYIDIQMKHISIDGDKVSRSVMRAVTFVYKHYDSKDDCYVYLEE